MAYLTTTTSTGGTLLGTLKSLYDGITLRMRQRRMYRETYEGLAALGNRELADLGLTRSELRHVAWEAAVGSTV